MYKIAGIFAVLTVIALILGFSGIVDDAHDAMFMSLSVNLGVITITSAFAGLMGVKEEREA